MFIKTKENFETEVDKYAKKNIISKLEKQGIDYLQLDEKDFDSLVADEIEILKSDSKKVGVGIGIGILISLVTGI
jgi:predicted transcriptional regulator